MVCDLHLPCAEASPLDPSCPSCLRVEGLYRGQIESLRRELEQARDEVTHLQRALQNSRDIGAAVGILMTTYKLPQAQAFELLRRSSQDANVKVARLALDVIDTGVLPGRCDPKLGERD